MRYDNKYSLKQKKNPLKIHRHITSFLILLNVIIYYIFKNVHIGHCCVRYVFLLSLFFLPNTTIHTLSISTPESNFNFLNVL